MPDIADLLDRTTPADLLPVDVSQLAHRARHGQQRRRAVVLAGSAAVAVTLVAGGLALRGGDEDPTVSTSNGRTPQLDLVTSLGDADVGIFVSRSITQPQKDALEQSLTEDPRVSTVRYLGDRETMAEFEKLFRNNPAMLEEGRKYRDLVPNSFRLKVAGDCDVVLDVLEHFATEPGVLQVTARPPC